MTVTQKNTEGLIGYPFAGNGAGCGCFTFNAGATPAQLAADSTLFDDWSVMVGALTNNQGAAHVTFLSSVTVPDGQFNFPVGSTFEGDAFLYPIINLSGGTIITGVYYWKSLEINNTAGAASPLRTHEGSPSATFMSFEEVSFAVTNVLTTSSIDGSAILVNGCSDPSGSGIGESDAVFEFTGTGNSGLLVVGGTKVLANAIRAENVAGTLTVELDDHGSTFSQWQADRGAAYTINIISNPISLGSAVTNRAWINPGGNVLFPDTALANLSVAKYTSLEISNGSGGSVIVNLGRLDGGATQGTFTDGQVLYVRNIGADPVVLHQPASTAGAGTEIGAPLFGAGAGTLAGTTGIGAGNQTAVTLMFGRQRASDGSPPTGGTVPTWIILSNRTQP